MGERQKPPFQEAEGRSVCLGGWGREWVWLVFLRQDRPLHEGSRIEKSREGKPKAKCNVKERQVIAFGQALPRYAT